MAKPTLTPKSQMSKSILTATGSQNDVAAAVPYGIYTGSLHFLQGAATQVAYTFKKLGGDVLDIELTVGNVFAAYEESVLEYSYQINLHQSKNMLSNVLGQSTASFDHEGQMTGGDASGSNVNLRYPKFNRVFCLV